MHHRWLHELPWGVHWEIARYVNTGFAFDRFHIQELTELQKLGSNVAAAPAVTRFVENERNRDQEDDKGKGKVDSDLRVEYAAAYAREQSAKVRVLLPASFPL